MGSGDVYGLGLALEAAEGDEQAEGGEGEGKGGTLKSKLVLLQIFPQTS